jgi:hypothetical protein
VTIGTTTGPDIPIEIIERMTSTENKTKPRLTQRHTSVKLQRKTIRPDQVERILSRADNYNTMNYLDQVVTPSEMTPTTELHIRATQPDGSLIKEMRDTIKSLQI